MVSLMLGNHSKKEAIKGGEKRLRLLYVLVNYSLF